MAAEIIKVYKEHLPSLRFVGKCYTNADRKGAFGHKWGEWFGNGWFATLEKPGELKGIENGYLGLMRCDGFDGENNVAVAWIKGKENDGLYALQHQMTQVM